MYPVIFTVFQLKQNKLPEFQHQYIHDFETEEAANDAITRVRSLYTNHTWLTVEAAALFKRTVAD